MAKNIFRKVMLNSEKIRTGRHLIDIITSGMYSYPLMVLREYVQNAADAIDTAVRSKILVSGKGRIEIHVDGEFRTLTISDNGSGIAPNDVVDTLCSIGCSGKKRLSERGFRGIGRLGGIGYCERLIFETRRTKAEPVVSAIWNAAAIRSELAEGDNDQSDLAETVSRNVTVELRESRDDPARFFRVSMVGVERFHKDLLMNILQMQNYLEQVAPVPFNYEFFPLGREIDSELAEVNGYCQYQVYLNGEQLFRPHVTEFKLSEKVQDRIIGVKFFPVPGANGNNIGKGWFAEMNHRASLPSRMLMRGIRVRQGNIEVGDEYFLADMFSERRFSTWHVGEVHVDLTLKTNSRRDGFEQSDDYQAFLEQAALLGRHLSELCRKSSKLRSSAATTCRLLEDFDMLIHDTPFAVSGSHRHDILNKAQQIYDRLEKIHLNGGSNGDLNKNELSRLQNELHLSRRDMPLLRNMLDGRRLRKYSDINLLLENISERLYDEYADDPPTAKKVIMQIVGPYLKGR